MKPNRQQIWIQVKMIYMILVLQVLSKQRLQEGILLLLLLATLLVAGEASQNSKDKNPLDWGGRSRLLRPKR